MLPPSLGFGFCLDYSVKNSFTVHRFVRPQLYEINHSSATWLRSFLFLLVFFVALAWISLLGKVNLVRDLVDNQRSCGAKIAGFDLPIFRQVMVAIVVAENDTPIRLQIERLNPAILAPQLLWLSTKSRTRLTLPRRLIPTYAIKNTSKNTTKLQMND